MAKYILNKKINSGIKSGVWQDFIADNDELIRDMCHIISTAYDLNECTTDHLEF